MTVVKSARAIKLVEEAKVRLSFAAVAASTSARSQSGTATPILRPIALAALSPLSFLTARSRSAPPVPRDAVPSSKVEPKTGPLHEDEQEDHETFDEKVGGEGQVDEKRRTTNSIP